MTGNNTAISVGDLTRQIKEILEGSFSQLWVEGEISNFIHHSSGHMYFTLKDDEAEIRCAMFKGNNQYLRFKPENGMKVLLSGRISVYAPRGQYQLISTRLEPAGLGTLFLAFEALKKRLSAEGLFDDEFKKPLPKIPETIGLITSKTGAAVKDMINVLGRRAPYVKLILRPTLVQGDEAAADIVNAIQEMDTSCEPDLIIFGRGGGSLEDLWPFNEEKVARAIFDCQTPTISAVGHETDTTIADLVADLRAPTPSAAAELAVPSIDELVQFLQTVDEKMRALLVRKLEYYWQKMDHIQDRFTLQRPDAFINRMTDLNTHLSSALKQSILMKLQSRFGQLETLQAELAVLNPKSILDRGYAIATADSGKIIHSPNELKTGELFRLQLAKGIISARKEKNTDTHQKKV
ncbi:MAG: exodeoxyribonuclease VII large subunit [Candidatus Marinimicrobia bacterium]|nr:exodeoxyribonuclease VII large subunit [Candidatus Neomarinimicrobiota bacterium]MDP6725816.1 exodeoxyribonuclease VII large subunit [Candidatus Neomarinimicrobiota bacterium]|tara:strand:- start:35423 stop:36643 length:1221 start_codon:yes stop_codon:yes gene_type:complete